MLDLQVLNVNVELLKFLKRWCQFWQVIIVFNFSYERNFIFVVNKVRFLILLVLFTKYVVIFNVKVTMFLSRFNVFVRIVFAYQLLTKDDFEVLGREDAESQQAQNENLLLRIIARDKFAFRLWWCFIWLLVDVKYFV